MTSPDIAVYDSVPNYHYSSFWKGREYEHEAEIYALSKIRPKTEPSGIFLDLGAGYGRLSSTYINPNTPADLYILADYSIQELSEAQRRIAEQYKNDKALNIAFVACNAYNLPFKENSIDSGQMIRVLHHLEKPERVVQELSRVVKQGFTVEFSNKFHLKAVLMHLSIGNLSFFKESRVDLKHKDTSQGIREGQRGIIMNFSFQYLQRIFEKHGWRVEQSRNVSFLRIHLAKKIIPKKILITVEKILQNLTSGFLHITPSIFLKLSKIPSKDEPEPKKRTKYTNAHQKSIRITDVLCCPKCKGELSFSNSKNTSNFATCSNCKLEFTKKEGTIDMRYPSIERFT